jgi:hypothetical protein
MSKTLILHLQQNINFTFTKDLSNKDFFIVTANHKRNILLANLCLQKNLKKDW